MPIQGARSRRTSTVVNARTDVRILATIARFYIAKDIPIPSIGGLVSASLEDFYHIITENFKEVIPFSSVAEASEFLKSIALRPTNSTGERALFRALTAESLRIESVQQPISTEPTETHETRLTKRQMLLDSLKEE